VMHSDQGYCMIGALEEAVRENYHLRVVAQRAVNRHLGLHRRWCDLPLWNDAPKRTRAEVIAALEATAWENRGR
jgi:hypothetical protein